MCWKCLGLKLPVNTYKFSETVTDCRTHMVERQKTYEKWPEAKCRISQFSLKDWMLDGDIVIGMYQFHLLKRVLAIACLNLFLWLAGLLFYWDTACLSDLYIYHSLQGSECHLCTQAHYMYVSCYSARHIQTSLRSTSLWLPVHLPSSVWDFLSAVEASYQALRSDGYCLLALHSYSSFFCGTSSIGLVKSYIGSKRNHFSFYAFSVVWYAFIPVSFSEISVPSSPLLWILGNVQHRPCLEWLMTFLK